MKKIARFPFMVIAAPCALIGPPLLSPAIASAFIGATVNTAAATGPAGQPLHVRTAPGGSKPSMGWINDGDNASLTGKCRRYNAAWNSFTAYDLNNFGLAQRNSRMKQTRTWCQVWFQTAPNVHKGGWSNANYLFI